MNMLADAATEVTPAMMGMVVIILLQLSQFLFAWKKDMRGTESAKKEDLTVIKNDIGSLRVEMKETIGDIADDLEHLKQSVETKMEASRVEASRSRSELYTKINEGALKTAALIEGTDTLKQSLLSLTTKVDLLRISNTSGPINGHRKTP